MYERIAKLIRALLSGNQEFLGKEVDKNAFFEFESNESDIEVCAIDGGESIILDCGAWLVSKTRVAYSIYKQKKIKEGFTNYLTLITFPDTGLQIKFSPENEEIKQIVPSQKDLREKMDLGIEQITEIPSIIRKYSEIQMAKKLMKKDRLVLMDQLLFSEAEQKLVREAAKKIQQCTVLGIAKTSRIKTQQGRSMLGYVSMLGEKIKKPWYYLLEEKNNGNIKDMVVKFHPKARNVYRVQIPKNLPEKEALSIAAYYSQDALLLGYPYPLVRADQTARISKHEQRTEQRRLEEQSFKLLKNERMSENFHKKLDERAYR